MHQDFWKTLAESITSGVEPEPSTSTSTESHGSFPSGIENTPAACHCLHQTYDGRWHGANHGGAQSCPVNHRGMLSCAYFLAGIDLQIHF